MDEVKYFYAKDGNQVGPHNFEDLGKLGLPPETLVWYEGLPDWKPINTFDEFAALYENLNDMDGFVPPVPNNGAPKKNVKPSVKTMFMRLLGVISGAFGLIMLLSLFGEFDVIALVVGVVFTALAVWIFKSNKVNYKMSEAEKEGQAWQQWHSD